VNNDNCGSNCNCAEESTARTAVFQPGTDIYETQNEVVILADVPGADSAGIELDFADGTLSVRAGVAARATPGGRMILGEYGVGDFERSFRIGGGIDTARITARVDAGVLAITLPKAEALRPRKIKVEAPAAPSEN
jgi:HSP20 family protein